MYLTELISKIYKEHHLQPNKETITFFNGLKIWTDTFYKVFEWPTHILKEINKICHWENTNYNELPLWSIRKANFWKTDNIKYWQGWRATETLNILFQELNSTIPLGRSLAVYYKTKHIPNIRLLTLHIYSGGIKTCA